MYSSMLVIFLGHCMPRIFLRCLLWKVLTVFSCLCVRVHRSLATYALKVLILIALLICLLSKMLFSVLKASIARIFLLLMSFSESSRLPSNFHFFHVSSSYRIISYSSGLDSLITKFRFARVDGGVSLIYVVLCLAMVAQLISSAYFGSISK